MLEGLQAKNKSIMKSTLLNELMKIPKDATLITVQGVEMQVIDKDEAVRLLDSDPNDSNIHECTLVAVISCFKQKTESSFLCIK